MAVLIDAHVHLDMYEDDELEGVLARFDELDIFGFAVSVDVESHERMRSIVADLPRLIPCFGVHPWEAPRYVSVLDELDPIIAATPMIGEIGLDHRFVEDESLYGPQREVFAYFLDAARTHDKVVNIHCTGAERLTAEMLGAFGVRRSIIHWYSGPLEDIRPLIDVGCYFTVGVAVLHDDHIRAVAAEIPDDRLLTETDNPGGAKWLTGEPGYPDLLVDVVEEVARIRGTSAEDVRARIAQNTARLIGGDEHLAPWHAAVTT